MKFNLKLSCMFITKKFICYLLVAGLAGHVFAQSSEPVLLTQQFDNYRKNSLPEKIYVHTDKNFYLAGEILWFKLYAVDGFFHQPLDMSKVAYVELLDLNNNPILQTKIKLEKGRGNGSFFVPVNINSGNYTFRAYSNWMKNFGAGYFFEKQVTIINTQKVSVLPAQQSRAAFDVHFYPEGGNLVNGLQSKVAFGVVDQTGKGIACKGVVINERKDTVAHFQTLKFGLGNFTFTPQANQLYTALLTLSNGTTLNRELPKAYTRGYVMTLETTNPKTIKLTVRYGEGELKQEAAMVYLFAHTRGAVKAAMGASIQNGVAIFLVDKDKLGDGISHFTIFNSDKKPVCERLYFKYPSQKLLVNVKADSPTYKVRQKVNINLTSTDQDGKPLEADLSMAVYRIDSLQLPGEAGINEYLWLGSDLVGAIESPGYYFNGTEEVTVAAMDNLMLTKGWRRFRWEDVLQNKKPFFQYVPENNGHIIYGKVINSKTGTAAANIQSFLSAPGTNTMFRTSLSNDSGRVKFEMKNLYGTSSIILQTNAEAGDQYRVEVDNPFSVQYNQRSLNPFTMPVKNPLTLLDHNIGVQVENMYQGDKRKQLNYELVDTTSFYYKPNEMYLLDNYVRFTTMEEVLREYVVAVNVRKRNGKFHLPVYDDGANINKLFENDPLILLDGAPVFDIEKLMRYDPLKIRKLDVITRQYYFGNMSFEGIINLFTYNGDLQGFDLDTNSTVIDYEGLQLEREFYSPVYKTAEQVTSHMPDFRNVLNWSPTIKTSKQGAYQTGFYCSDLPGKYAVVVQGLTQSGISGSTLTFFEVKKPSK
jgi:hypothetical protein